MSVKIRLRRDTASNWNTVNPILKKGEFGYETDTKKNKVGNGVDNWSTLLYSIYNGSSSNYTLQYEATNPTSTVNPASRDLLYINKTSGEIFVCNDRTENANHWVGTNGTII